MGTVGRTGCDWTGQTPGPASLTGFGTWGTHCTSETQFHSSSPWTHPFSGQAETQLCMAPSGGASLGMELPFCWSRGVASGEVCW